MSLKSLFGNNKILVIGESYGQPESAQFVSEKVKDYLDGGACLKVGLEIPSDQQQILDSAMRGEVSMSDVQIDNVIDHDDYREMMVSFSEAILVGECLSVYAINPPKSVTMAKDVWMEQEVVKFIDNEPIVLLVGNKHAVNNYKTTGDDSKSLAKRLHLRNLGVSSILQHWNPAGSCAIKTGEIYSTTKDNKSGIYVKESIGGISASKLEKVSMITDGVVVWDCETATVY